MLRSRMILTPLVLVAGCYSPNAPIADDDGGTTDDGASTGATVTGSPTGPTDPSGEPTTSAETNPSDPSDSSDSTTPTTDTVDDTTTSIECEDARECGDGELCIDGACGTCDTADDPDAACAAVSADAPYCQGALGCVACRADACEGATPACNPDVGCVACTEHSECPDSACHLAGPDVGGCFDIADVVEVSDTAEFEAELASLGPGSQRVFYVVGAVPDMGHYSLTDVEVAIIGTPGAALMGGYTNMLSVDSGAFLYVASIEISNGPYRAFGNGGVLWLDDVDVSAFRIGLLNSGEAHIRRSRFTAAGMDSMALQSDGTLFAENSAFGPGAETGIRLDANSVTDLRYVTVAGNVAGFSCDSSVSGTVRNSIVASTGASSISGCTDLTWADDGVDENGYGEQIGAYNVDWFVDADGGDFHLSAAGVIAIGDIADWDDGDPLVDIDGDARPMDASGRPGIDEP